MHLSYLDGARDLYFWSEPSSISLLCVCMSSFVCFDSLYPRQHFFIHVGTGLPGLYQY